MQPHFFSLFEQYYQENLATRSTDYDTPRAVESMDVSHRHRGTKQHAGCSPQPHALLAATRDDIIHFCSVLTAKGWGLDADTDSHLVHHKRGVHDGGVFATVLGVISQRCAHWYDPKVVDLHDGPSYGARCERPADRPFAMSSFNDASVYANASARRAHLLNWIVLRKMDVDNTAFSNKGVFCLVEDMVTSASDLAPCTLFMHTSNLSNRKGHILRSQSEWRVARFTLIHSFLLRGAWRCAVTLIKEYQKDVLSFLLSPLFYDDTSSGHGHSSTTIKNMNIYHVIALSEMLIQRGHSPTSVNHLPKVDATCATELFGLLRSEASLSTMENPIDVILSEVSGKGNEYGCPLRGMTPLLLAVTCGNLEVASLLRAAGARTDVFVDPRSGVVENDEYDEYDYGDSKQCHTAPKKTLVEYCAETSELLVKWLIAEGIPIPLNHERFLGAMNDDDEEMSTPFLTFAVHRSKYCLGFGWLFKHVPMDITRMIGEFLFTADMVENYLLTQVPILFFDKAKPPVKKKNGGPIPL